MSGSSTPPNPSTSKTTPTFDPNALVAAMQALAASGNCAFPQQQPTVPRFEYDPAIPNSAALWFDRVKSIFRRHNLSDADKVALTAEVLDSSTYQKVARALLPSKKLSTLDDFDLLETTMVGLFDRTESLFAKRYALFQMEWKGPEHEPFAEYCARIRENVAAIDPANFKETELETLVCLMGMKHPALEGFRIQVLNLLNRDPATALAKCSEVVTATCLTQREQKLPTGTAVNFVKKINSGHGKKPFKKEGKKQSQTCASCGGLHERSSCKFREAKCNFCKKIGHIEKVCFAKNNNRQSFSGNAVSFSNTKKSSRRPNVRYVDTADSSNDIRSSNIRILGVQSDVDVSSCSSSTPSNGRHMVKVMIGDVPMVAQLDNGSDISIISLDEYEKLGKPKLTGQPISARAANKTELSLLGSFCCSITLNERSEDIALHVADVASTLLGLNFYRAFELDAIPLRDVICNVVASECIAPPGAVDSLLEEFKPLFVDGLGCCTKAVVQLQLKKDSIPFFTRPRRLSMHGNEVLKTVIDKNVVQGVMYKVNYSEYSSPCSLVPRKDGRHRLVVDYSTGLNERLEEPCYTLPLPEDIFAKLSGCTVFSQLDFSDAYHQVQLDQESQKYTTIATPFGLFRYKRLSQGLKTAVSDFQEIVETMLSDIDPASPFLDDVLVASNGTAQHTKDLKRVLGRIMEWGFRLNPKKCKFYCSKIRFLGKLIDANGIRPDPEKVAAIKSMPDPTDVSTLRSFLGLVNYYQQFIPAFRDLREPLDDLLKDGISWEWTDLHRQAANQIRGKLTNQCMLTHYDPRLPLIVAADASQNGIGGVISHRYADGQEKPIQFFSRALDATQRKYSQTDKEALALVTAIKIFHRYLEGQHFTLLTDHKALLAVFGNKKNLPVLAANRLHRWAIFLAAYNFDIQYKKTTEFGQADAVSRLIARTRNIPELFEEEDDLSDGVFSDITVNAISRLPLKAADLVKEYELDDYGQLLLSKLADGTNDSKFSLVNGIIMMQNRVYIPAVLRERVLEQLHAGHNGITLTKQLARQHVFWPGITKDIETLINSCHCCIQLSKTPAKTTLASWSVSMKPGDRVHLDFAGPWRSKMLLIIVDSCSKWMDVRVLDAATSSTTIDALGRYIADNGVIRVLVSDNGRQFTSDEFADFCDQRGIKHMRSPVYHPQSNGQAERCVDIVKRYVKKRAIQDGQDFDLKECVNDFLLHYRSTPSTATPGNVTPAFAHHGHELRTTMELLRPHQTIGPDLKMEEQFNLQHGARPRHLLPGDQVFARKQKEKPLFQGIVQKRVGSKVYVILDMDGKTHRLHINQLIKRAFMVPEEDEDSVCDASNVHQSSGRNSPTPSAPSPTPSRRSTSPSTASTQSSSPASSPPRSPVRRYPARIRKQPDRLQLDPKKKSYTN